MHIEQKDTEYVLAGHSHMYAMGAPWNYKGPISMVASRRPAVSFLMEEWSGTRSSDYWSELARVSRHRTVLLVYGGNQHHGQFLLAPAEPFDLVDERTPDLIEGARIVPRRMVTEFFRASTSHLRTLVRSLRDAGCCDVRIVGTPPPKRDLEEFSELIKKAPFTQEMAARKGIDLTHMKLTPAPILLKLWRVVQCLMEEVASTEGAMFISVPETAADNDGFLSGRFYDYKPVYITHANEEFGTLMLERAVVGVR